MLGSRHQAGVCVPCLLDWCWRDTEECIETAATKGGALDAITFHYYPLKQGLAYNGSQLLMEPSLLDKVQRRIAPYAALRQQAVAAGKPQLLELSWQTVQVFNSMF